MSTSQYYWVLYESLAKPQHGIQHIALSPRTPYHDRKMFDVLDVPTVWHRTNLRPL
jgi:hypothetical protein